MKAKVLSLTLVLDYFRLSVYHVGEGGVALGSAEGWKKVKESHRD